MTTLEAAEGSAALRETARVRDLPLFVTPRTPNELELQARWFTGDFGKEFRSTIGEKIEVVQFGTWNREAGPDFRDASISVNGGQRVRGSIEFDLTDRSWESHGHATNPAFDDTILHVFVNQSEREFFTRTSRNRNVPQVRVDPATLPDAFVGSVPLARPGRCHAPLRGLPEARVTGILDAAAQFRLRRKARRLQRIATDHGRDEALFQELAAALGYKQNKLPFTLIAQRVSLRALRDSSADAEALLFGIGGFLASDLASYDRSSRGYVRELWDRWWPQRDAMHRLIVPKQLWKLGGARPLNHPQRRLGALAALAQEWRKCLDSLRKPEATAVRAFLKGLHHPFWDFHYTLTSDPTSAPMALIGNTRIVDILANVIFPWWLADGAKVWSEFATLRTQLSNRRIETAAARLFGDDPRRTLFLKTVAHQQGLLQIYEDFCMQDSSDCSHCPFPEQMQNWK
jgi:hypothetical protein